MRGKNQNGDLYFPITVLFENPMNNLIPQFIDKCGRGLRAAYLQFDSFASNMNEAHFAVFAVIVIGIGVILMRGKPVQGS